MNVLFVGFYAIRLLNFCRNIYVLCSFELYFNYPWKEYPQIGNFVFGLLPVLISSHDHMYFILVQFPIYEMANVVCTYFIIGTHGKEWHQIYCDEIPSVLTWS